MEVEAKLEAFLEENEIILIPVEVRSKLTQSFETFNSSVKSLKREYDDFKVLKGKIFVMFDETALMSRMWGRI